MKGISLNVLILLVAIAHPTIQGNPADVFRATLLKTDAHPPIGGIISGAKQCGGSGTLLQYRIQGCNASVSCQLVADGDTMHSEMDFVSPTDVPELKYKLTILYNSLEAVVYDEKVAKSAVATGTRYTLHLTGAVPEGIKGKFRGTHELSNAADGAAVMCMEIETEFV